MRHEAKDFLVPALLIVGCVIGWIACEADCAKRTCRPGNEPVLMRNGCYCVEVPR